MPRPSRRTLLQARGIHEGSAWQGDPHWPDFGTMSEPITILEITLSRVINEDGLMTVKVKTPATFNAVEILGLLAAAQCQIFHDMNEGRL